MCLAIPMKISEIRDTDTAVVVREETQMEINISLLNEPKVGDYVIVHAGFGIDLLDIQEAETRIQMFREMAEAAGETDG